MMNSPESFGAGSNKFTNQIAKNWNNLEEPQKLFLKKIWNVITYKWQLHILIIFPFLIWWLLDKSVAKVHEFDNSIVSNLNLPEWVVSFIGFGQLS